MLGSSLCISVSFWILALDFFIALTNLLRFQLLQLDGVHVRMCGGGVVLFNFLFVFSSCFCLISKSRLTLVMAWTAACQAPLSMEFSRQEYWSGLPFPSPGDLPDPRIKPASSSLAGGSFTTEPPGKLTMNFKRLNMRNFIYL